MANEKTTIYIVSTWNNELPTLVSASGERTKKQVRLTERSKHFGFLSVLPIADVHFTPAAALAAWHKQCEQAVAAVQAELDAAIALRDAEVRGVNRQ